MYLSVSYEKSKGIVIFAKRLDLIKAIHSLVSKEGGILKFLLGENVNSLVTVAKRYADEDKQKGCRKLMRQPAFIARDQAASAPFDASVSSSRSTASRACRAPPSESAARGSSE